VKKTAFAVLRIHCFVGCRKYKSHCPIRSSATSSRSRRQRRRSFGSTNGLAPQRHSHHQEAAHRCEFDAHGRPSDEVLAAVYEQYSAEFGKIQRNKKRGDQEYADGYGQLSDEQADNPHSRAGWTRTSRQRSFAEVT